MAVICPHCRHAVERTDAPSDLEIHCPSCRSSFRLDEVETVAWTPHPDRAQPGRLEEGQTISHYFVLERLGRGGMGVVYRAQDLRLGRNVALKFISEKYAQDHLVVQRFQREARTASELNHPHICTVHDIDEFEGQPFIVMELLQGQTLTRHLDGKPLPLAELLDLGVQIADALDAAHARGIVHRDIKPVNVIINERGQAKILDFGLAKLLEEREQRPVIPSPPSEPDSALSSPGLIVGTAWYMSPEQARGEELDARSDLYSFGMVLYEMATGTRLVQETSTQLLGAPVPPTRPRSPRLVNPEVPEPLDEIIIKALERDRAARYQTAAEMRTDLKRLQRELDPGFSSGIRPGAVAAPSPSQVKSRHWLWPILLLPLVALVLAAAWLGFFDTPNQPPGPRPDSTPLQFVPFTSYPGEEFGTAFSPDGSQVAFVWNGENGENYDIYVKAIKETTPRRLTTHADADAHPTWSADGGEIAFIRYTKEGRRDIMAVPSTGGPERKLYSASLGPPDSALAWSPDGRFLAFSERADGEAAKTPFSIFQLSLEDRQLHQLTFPPAEHSDRLPRYSPDGQTVAFTRGRSRVQDIYVMPVAGGEPRRLTSDGVEIRGLDWTADGGEIVFSSTRGARAALWRVGVAGGTPQVLPGLPDNVYGPAVARQGRRLAFTQRLDDRNIWRFPATPSAAAESPAVRLISSTRDETLPQYAPDGQSIAFGSDRSGSTEVWRCASDGSAPVQLTHFGGPQTGTPRWSPDSRRLAFDSRFGGHADIYLIAAEGGQPQRFTTLGGDNISPSWSRDGQWVWFCSNSNGGQQVWKQPVDGGEAVQVTKQGGTAPFESPDGQWVYYWRGGQERGIWKTPVNGGAETLVHESVAPHYWGSWALTAQGIFFLHEQTTPEHSRKATLLSTIKFFDFSTGQLSDIAFLDKPAWGLAISPDGRWLLSAQYDVRGSDIMLVEGFR